MRVLRRGPSRRSTKDGLYQNPDLPWLNATRPTAPLWWGSTGEPAIKKVAPSEAERKSSAATEASRMGEVAHIRQLAQERARLHAVYSPETRDALCEAIAQRRLLPGRLWQPRLQASTPAAAAAAANAAAAYSNAVPGAQHRQPRLMQTWHVPHELTGLSMRRPGTVPAYLKVALAYGFAGVDMDKGATSTGGIAAGGAASQRPHSAAPGAPGASFGAGILPDPLAARSTVASRAKQTQKAAAAAGSLRLAASTGQLPSRPFSAAAASSTRPRPQQRPSSSSSALALAQLREEQLSLIL